MTVKIDDTFVEWTYILGPEAEKYSINDLIVRMTEPALGEDISILQSFMSIPPEHH